MLRTIIVFILFFCLQQIYAQSPLIMEGKVSFVTQETVYIKFTNTNLINAGDTLFIKKDGTNELIPVLLVNAKSTTTCVASYLGEKSFSAGQIIYSYQIPIIKKKEKEKVVVPEIVKKVPIIDTIPKVKTKRDFPIIHGRINLSNSSNFSSSNSQQSSSRQVGSLVLDATNVGSPRISAETNISYSMVQTATPSSFSSQQSLFRVYGLSVKYSFKSGGQAVFGRSYNYNLSSIGAVDGLQIEKKYKNFSAGVIIGYRPDMFDLSFNSKLFQVGGYVAHNLRSGNFSSTTTLGFIGQKNNLKIDRNYAVFQHSSYYKKIRLFGSSEVDLYNPLSNKLRITSVYASANFNVTKKAAFMFSYDTRKTIIYYETYKAYVDQYLKNDLAMNGLRFSWNMQWGKGISSSLSSGLRYQSDQENQSTNYNASVSWNDMPIIKSSVTLSANSNTSNSILTQSYSANISQNIIPNKFQMYLYISHQEYQYIRWTDKHIENEYYGGSINFNFTPRFSINAYYEFSIIDSQKYQNLNLNLAKRF